VKNETNVIVTGIPAIPQNPQALLALPVDFDHGAHWSNRFHRTKHCCGNIYLRHILTLPTDFNNTI
jgi:hypothetical protein